ncbi:carboxypeptidase regulatory-like domain-containing protein [bacterium]|nr:carboxypeptidase regulatory-like domain-containing protein [bacterium]
MNNHIYIRVFFIAIVVFISAVTISGAFAQTRASVTVSAVTEDSYSPVVLIIDGKLVEVESLQFMRGQQVMIWLRDLENLGWGKAYSDKSGEIIFKGNGVTLSFTKNGGLAKVNSLSVKLPVDTYTRDGKLMVPLSFTAKALGYDCEIAYKPVAAIKTYSRPATTPESNSLEGRVIYAGKGAAGIKVRAVDRDFNVVGDTVTDANGTYRFDNLPAGEYAAFVYTKDNPTYFNRVSEAAVLNKGDEAHLKPISLGRILAPKSPKPGGMAKNSSGNVLLEWTKCEAAVSYELTIARKNSEPSLAFTSKEPKARIPANKLKHGEMYEAQVSALDANGDYVGGTVGAGGEPWSFVFE